MAKSKYFLATIIIGCLLGTSVAWSKTQIVAAENMYGELAQQLSSEYSQVTSILNNPSQDPHLFSAAPSIAKSVAEADIIIYNGIDYDNWIQKLLSIKSAKSQKIIVVADLVGAKAGMNPHLWYDPATMPLLATTLTKTLQSLDKSHKDFYQQRLAQFLQEYQALQADIYRLKSHFQNTPVIATEPVFGYLAQALGLQMRGEALQWAVMNETSPSPSQLKAFEDELTQKRVHVLIYNKQVSEPLTQRLLNIARKAGIPCIGVTETQPPGMSYIQWMRAQLSELEKALANGRF